MFFLGGIGVAFVEGLGGGVLGVQFRCQILGILLLGEKIVWRRGVGLCFLGQIRIQMGRLFLGL